MVDPINPGGENLEESKRQLAEMMQILGESFNNANANLNKLGVDTKKTFENVFKSIRTTEEQYLSYISSAEKNRFRRLVAERDNLIKKIKEQYSQEVRMLMNQKGLGESVEKAIADKRMSFLQKIHTVEKAKAKEIADARKAAMSSEVFGPRLRGLGGMVASRAMAIPGAGAIAAGAGAAGPWGAALAALGLLINRLFNLGKIATRTEADFRNAGQTTLTLGSTFKNTFKELQDSVPEFRNLEKFGEFMSEVAASPKLLQQVTQDGGKAATDFIDQMGRLGIGVVDSGRLAADAMNSWGASTGELVAAMKTARSLTKATGIDAKTAFNSMLNLMTPLKNLTFTAEDAASSARQMAATMALALGGKLKFSPAEVQRTTQAMGDFLGGMSASKWAGMIAFTKGTMPTFKQTLEASQKPFETYVEFARKAIRGVPAAQKGFAVESLASSGLAAGVFSTPKMAESFLEVIHAFETNSKDAEKLLKEFEAQNKAEGKRKGLDTLANLQSPLENLFNALVGLTDAITKTNGSGLLGAVQSTNTLLNKITTVGNITSGFSTAASAVTSSFSSPASFIPGVGPAVAAGQALYNMAKRPRGE